MEREQQQPWRGSCSFIASSFTWPPRSYPCSFCRREFRSAQALGGHMNVHRRDRARLRHAGSPPPLPPATVVTPPAAAAAVPNLNYPPPQHHRDGGKKRPWTATDDVSLGLGFISSRTSVTSATDPAAVGTSSEDHHDGLDLELRLGVS